MGVCRPCHASSIERGSGNGPVRPVSVEKLRGTDLGHGEIGAAAATDTCFDVPAWMLLRIKAMFVQDGPDLTMIGVRALVWAVGQIRSF